ncbi:hypothetical protein HGRIS_007170 [Hohenbuehelia grisea]|uniref:CBM1 domain-containing protein n=1 Tax=Hohenbuehelia grisea TaxID=104357 RepID=A0ABR3JBE0_9AGAR
MKPAIAAFVQAILICAANAAPGPDPQAPATVPPSPTPTPTLSQYSSVCYTTVYTAPPNITPTPLPPPPPSAGLPIWGQCGGIGWTPPGGLTQCTAGSVCNKLNDYYSQCIPGPNTAPTSTFSFSFTFVVTSTYCVSPPKGTNP